MKKDYEKLFTYLNRPEPSEGLFAKIMQQIYKEKNIMVIKRRLALFSFGVLGSVAAFYPVLNMVKIEMAESGFIKFVSLIFSDFRVIITYWQSFAFAVLESLPVLSVLLFFIVIFTFLGSLKFFIKDVKFIFNFAKNS